MMRSLFSGITGLQNHQIRMDVIGNNIANVNTTGFKASRADFHDIFSQTLQGASAGTAGRGGTNPKQIGLGMGLASISTLFTESSFQPTGKYTDLAIQGQGFFVLSDDVAGVNKSYTRAGNFDFDAAGNFVVSGTGMRVLGWTADANGNVNNNSPATPITTPANLVTLAPKQTSLIKFGNNLDAEATSTLSKQISLYDSLGAEHLSDLNLTRVNDNSWVYAMNVPDANNITGQYGMLEFAPDGKLISTKTLTGVQQNYLDFSGFQLDNTSVAGTTETVSFTVFDSNNRPRLLDVEFTADSAGGWNFSVLESGNASPLASGNIPAAGFPFNFTGYPITLSGESTSININGSVSLGAGSVGLTNNPNYAGGTLALTQEPLTFDPLNPLALPVSTVLDFNAVTQFSNPTHQSTMVTLSQDGYGVGELKERVIDADGVIWGKYSNDEVRKLGQVAMAVFNNPGGLFKTGDTLFTQSSNSGDAQIGTANSAGRGAMASGNLEMSNVDLAQEFSNMIITQRGFQANSKIITVSDEMLQDLANLKR